MNVYLFELKAMLKSAVIWIVSLLATFFIFLVGFYPVFEDSAEDMKKILEGFPPAFADAFGMGVVNIFNYTGYYTFCFEYIALVGAIMAIAITIACFGREKRSKCVDFFLTKPLNRKKIFFYKLLSILTTLIITNIVCVSLSMILFHKHDIKENALAASLALLLTQLVFVSFGIMTVTFTKKIRSVSGAATAFGFGAFICSALSNIIDEDWIQFLAPFKYFSPGSLFEHGHFDSKLVWCAAFIIIAGILASFLAFIKSDAHAV